jgi:hypothetical protein
MPTGYTAAIADGITFREYALGCARAFGALITMRDDPQDAPIPERFRPSDWHANELQKASERLTTLRLMSPAEADIAAQQEYEEAVTRENKYAQERAALRSKYEAMLAKVIAWQAPTPDHVGYKEFMEQQIRDSIKWDCSDYERAPERWTGKEWLARAIEKAKHDIEYHTRQHAEEIERVRGRNAWIKALRDSLS